MRAFRALVFRRLNNFLVLFSSVSNTYNPNKLNDPNGPHYQTDPTNPNNLNNPKDPDTLITQAYL